MHSREDSSDNFLGGICGLRLRPSVDAGTEPTPPPEIRHQTSLAALRRISGQVEGPPGSQGVTKIPHSAPNIRNGPNGM